MTLKHSSTRAAIYGLVTVATIGLTQSVSLSAPANMGSANNAFAHPPTLVRSNATDKAAYTPSTYEFTITVPEDAGAPLKAVTITQEPNLDTVRFNPNRSHAFMGNRYASRTEIPLTHLGGPETPGTTTIVFEQPVQPGSTVTVAVDSRNPGWGGIYEFGVTAYPNSENSRGQFLGYGRINFYGTGD